MNRALNLRWTSSQNATWDANGDSGSPGENSPGLNFDLDPNGYRIRVDASLLPIKIQIFGVLS